VGLYRTEFIYLNRQALPSEEDHYQFYAKVAQSVLPHPVIIRTLDIGGDKLVDLGFPGLTKSEPNPFLGLRGIRLALKHDELFRTQLRAILRASAHGKVRSCFPWCRASRSFAWPKRTVERAWRNCAKRRFPSTKKSRWAS
jgi:phosphotransferase system enzyme I (PtsI)